MSDLIQTIKKAAVQAVWQQKPTKVLVGKIESIDPLNIRIDNRLLLDNDFLVLTRIFKSLIDDNAVSISDKVLMLRDEGGQRFFVLDKLI